MTSLCYESVYQSGKYQQHQRVRERFFCSMKSCDRAWTFDCAAALIPPRDVVYGRRRRIAVDKNRVSTSLKDV